MSREVFGEISALGEWAPLLTLRSRATPYHYPGRNGDGGGMSAQGGRVGFPGGGSDHSQGFE
jgi:hypothetical protein